MAQEFKAFRKIGHVTRAATQSFFRDDCYNKASALTFYTIQAIVPLLAFLLGVAQGFGLDEYLQTLITKSFDQQQEVLTYAIQLKGGVMAGFGVVFLIYTTVNLLQYIETAYNDIWKIRSKKSYFQKFSDYLAALIVCPLIVAVSTSLTFYLKTQLLSWEENPSFEHFSVYLLPFFKVIPWILSWVVFFFIYYLIPDSTSKLWTKVVGAIFAGTLFQLWQILYFTLQAKVFSYNAVYGTFAVIPLFLIWLQFSWLIALAGAELAAHLEIDLYSVGKHAKTINHRELALLIVYHCFQTFYKGQKPLSDGQLSKQLKIPLNLVQKMIDVLVKGNILAEVKTSERTIGYNPFSDGKCFSLKSILDVIDNQQNVHIFVDSSEALKVVSQHLHQIDDLVQRSPANISIQSLLFFE
jgi:membrane protein